jgi:hypothetical protein
MAGPGEILMARLGLPRRNHREGGHGLRVVIHVQQIFWAMEVYIAVVAAQRVTAIQRDRRHGIIGVQRISALTAL